MKKILTNKDDKSSATRRIYNRIIDALKTQFLSGGKYEVHNSLFLHKVTRPDNMLVQVHKGTFAIDEDNKPLEEGSFYFIPAGKPFSIRYGRLSPSTQVITDIVPEKEELITFIRPVSSFEDSTTLEETFSMITFNASLYDAASFFTILDLPSIEIPFENQLSFLVKHICEEDEQNKIGRRTIIENYIQEIVIHLCRYIDSIEHFRKNIERIEYLLDKRLVDIVLFIHNNLDKDLSNKAIAAIAYVSEDYVGQFFKSLTSRNLQDYIEDQRLDRAMQMLRTSGLNIQEIARRVGFRDPAYFSRRFKIKFGENANSIRNEPVDVSMSRN